VTLRVLRQFDSPRYTVHPTARSLREVGGKIAPGTILAHSAVVIITTCPACGSMLIAPGPVRGELCAPVVDRPVRCGAGLCKKCGILFRIMNGIAEEVIDETAAIPIPDKLKAAGVVPPPKQPE
jgi:hypothetical protein